jgi:sortase A
MTLRRLNNLLTVVVVLLGCYIALSPLLPSITFWFRDDTLEVIAPYAGALAERTGSTSVAPPPQENRLVIPSISLNEVLYEGNSINVINNGGTWHRPTTPNPIEGGNMVVVGHRYFRSVASTFYHLDKIRSGDVMAVYWEGQEFVYQVTLTKIVEANELEIEGPTEQPQLTLYTCHPLWTAAKRLVVIAVPVATETGDS